MPSSALLESVPARAAPRLRPRFRSLWISDLHLGTRACRAEPLLEFLEGTESEHLYLVGDVIDGWSLQRSWYWNAAQKAVVKAILRKAAEGTCVRYLVGNHDEFLRGDLGFALAGVSLVDHCVHEDARGRHFLVLHGDRYDRAMQHPRWVTDLGDRVYSFGVALERGINSLRHRFGGRPLCLAGPLREKFKAVTSYVEDFENAVIEATRGGVYHGVICGHIHRASLREEQGFLYCNTGDWVESCTALAEHEDGTLALLGRRENGLQELLREPSEELSSAAG